jgi:P27 family predicted phage terminase small subunit
MPTPRKPTKLKLLQGTLKPSRFNPDEPQIETEIPDIPIGLSDLAKEEWARITPLLEELGLIGKINLSSLAQYCAFYARWLEAERMINEHGSVIMIEREVRRDKMGTGKYDKPGEVVADKIYCKAQKSPWVDIALKNAQECRKLAVQFGMTPSSAAGVITVGNPKEKKKDDRVKDKNRFFK